MFNSSPVRCTVRQAAVSLALAVGLFGAAACVPPQPPTVGAVIAADQSVENVIPGTVVTVSGAGFNPAGNLGTRPPFFGRPAGVYVAFGRFGNPWRPSQGATSSARQIISQVWALPRAQHDQLDPTGALPEIVLMNPDGTFQADLVLTEAAGSGAYGIATYPGSGAVNAGEELFTSVRFAAL